jgi:hypothetical protein
MQVLPVGKESNNCRVQRLELELHLQECLHPQVFKRVWYSPPVLGGQLDPKRIEWSDKTSGFRDTYASTKTLLPYILVAVNKEAGSQFAFALSAIEDELRTIRAAFKQSKEEKLAFKAVLVERHTITMLLAAVRLHHNKAHKSVKKETKTTPFLNTSLSLMYHRRQVD